MMEKVFVYTIPNFNNFLLSFENGNFEIYKKASKNRKNKIDVIDVLIDSKLNLVYKKIKENSEILKQVLENFDLVFSSDGSDFYFLNFQNNDKKFIDKEKLKILENIGFQNCFLGILNLDEFKKSILETYEFGKTDFTNFVETLLNNPKNIEIEKIKGVRIVFLNDKKVLNFYDSLNEKEFEKSKQNSDYSLSFSSLILMEISNVLNNIDLVETSFSYFENYLITSFRILNEIKNSEILKNIENDFILLIPPNKRTNIGFFDFEFLENFVFRNLNENQYLNSFLNEVKSLSIPQIELFKFILVNLKTLKKEKENSVLTLNEIETLNNQILSLNELMCLNELGEGVCFLNENEVSADKMSSESDFYEEILRQNGIENLNDSESEETKNEENSNNENFISMGSNDGLKVELTNDNTIKIKNTEDEEYYSKIKIFKSFLKNVEKNNVISFKSLLNNSKNSIILIGGFNFLDSNFDVLYEQKIKQLKEKTNSQIIIFVFNNKNFVNSNFLIDFETNLKILKEFSEDCDAKIIKMDFFDVQTLLKWLNDNDFKPIRIYFESLKYFKFFSNFIEDDFQNSLSSEETNLETSEKMFFALDKISLKKQIKKEIDNLNYEGVLKLSSKFARNFLSNIISSYKTGKVSFSLG